MPDARKWNTTPAMPSRAPDPQGIPRPVSLRSSPGGSKLQDRHRLNQSDTHIWSLISARVNVQVQLTKLHFFISEIYQRLVSQSLPLERTTF